MSEIRRSARAVLVDGDERVLLLFGPIQEGTRPRACYAPGGRLEPGENFVTALVRELDEELGLRLLRVGPHVWTRRSVRRRAGVDVPTLAHFFFTRVAAFEPDLSAIGESEAGVEWKWWTTGELRATPATVIPAACADHVEPLLRGYVPTAPIEVS